ncbi:hypothetical protein ACIBQ5_17695 [Streptomyces massasporeus]|uniref:hypothetical protein n=1 Tax=Streptomyces massasporeus TaxID=67324 RepID=UPI003796F6DF
MTYPLVVGPDNLPVITDPRTAAEKPAMAVFSALAHANSPHIDAILDALGRALAGMDWNAASYFFQFLDSALGDTPAGDKWRDIVTFVNYFPGRGTVMEKAYLEGEAKGEARGEAKAILRFLEARGVSVPQEARDQIAGCTDLDLLNRWLDRTPHVQNVDELFVEDAAPAADRSET